MRSLSTRMVLLVTLPLLAAIALTVGVEYRSTRDQMIASAVRESTTEALVMRVAIEPVLDDDVARRDVLDRISRDLDVRNVRVLRRADVTEDLSLRAIEDRHPASSFEGGVVRCRAPLRSGRILPTLPQKDITHVLLFEHDVRQALTDLRAETLRRGLLAAAAAILIAGCLYALLHQMVLAPTKLLAQQATRLGMGELDARSGMRADAGEIHLLGATFDRMADRIQTDTERREHLERQLDASIADLAGKNEELERFAYTVSHDLKSPLVTIGGFISYMQDDVARQDVSRLPADLERVREAVSRMMTLVDDLLHLSRAGRGIEIQPDVELTGLARDAIDDLAASLLDVEVRLDPLPIADVDPTRMREVFQNLIANAARYRTDVEPTIVIEGEDRGDTVVVRCTDNGIGIEKADLDRVFGLFERVDGSRPGSGVGLAVVQRIVGMHRGVVRVESEGRGTGSTFTVEIPRHA
ncbi:MAG: HAMP domain-containing histidine kinase [Phycisphaerales bacterium]|nr:HAMP domain-containing histidine kinase [Phycisphaerales bacterium]